MSKYIFNNTYGDFDIPNSITIEAEDEDEAWKEFNQKVIQPIVNAFTCDLEEE